MEKQYNRFEKPNAARMSAAGEGSTEPNYSFLSIGKKMQTNLGGTSKVTRFPEIGKRVF